MKTAWKSRFLPLFVPLKPLLVKWKFDGRAGLATVRAALPLGFRVVLRDGLA